TDGRWISEDPLGFRAGDTDLYRYVQNEPTVATDSSGLSIDRTPRLEYEQVPVAPADINNVIITPGIPAGWERRACGVTAATNVEVIARGWWNGPYGNHGAGKMIVHAMYFPQKATRFTLFLKTTMPGQPTRYRGSAKWLNWKGNTILEIDPAPRGAKSETKDDYWIPAPSGDDVVVATFVPDIEVSSNATAEAFGSIK